MTSKDEELDQTSHKRETFKSFLDLGLVMVHLDPRPEDVVVPPVLKKDSVVRLNFDLGFNLPVFEYSDMGIRAVLSFQGTNFECIIPWRVVFAMTLPEQGHMGVVWEGSFPPEIREAALASKGAQTQPKVPKPKFEVFTNPSPERSLKERPKLRLVTVDEVGE